MPDINNRIGIDSLDQNILMQDSLARFDKLFNQPLNPNSALAPLSQIGRTPMQEYDPILGTPIQKREFTGNPEIDAIVDQMKASRRAEQYLQKNDPLYGKGLGEKWYLPYKPIEKFLDESMGFKPMRGSTLQEQYVANDDAYATIKNSTMNGISKFFGRTVLGAIGKAGQGISQLAGLATGWLDPTVWYDIANGEDYLTAAGDNLLSKAFEYLDQDLKNDWMPVYQEASSRDKGFWYRLLNDGSFWMNEISDGAAFAISAFVPALAASKLQLGARAMAGLSRFASGENAVLGTVQNISNVQRSAKAFADANGYLRNAARAASFVDRSAVTVANTFSESYFESRETYDNVYQKLLDEGEPEVIAREKAQNAAKGTFWANIPALLFSNAFETKLQFQALGMNRIDDFVRRGVTQATPFGAYSVAQPVTKFGKFLASPVGFYAKKLPEAILKEGYWEENVQHAIQRYYGDTTMTKKGIFDQMTDILGMTAKQAVAATLGRDPEAAISIGLGGLIGSGHTIISSAIANEYKNNKNFRNEVVRNLNQLQDNWLKYGDPYERDGNGNIATEEVTNEDGTVTTRPKVSIPRVVAYSLKVNELSDKLGFNDELKNETLNTFVNRALFSELVIANINAGTIETFKENLKNSKNYSEEDLNRMGFTKPQEHLKQVDENLRLVERIEALEKSINNDVLFKQIRSKDDVGIERQRHQELLRSGVLQIVTGDLIAQNEKELGAVEAKLNAKYPQTNIDAVVSRLNAIESQQRYNNQVLANRDNEAISAEQYVAAESLAAELAEEKEKLLKENEEELKNVTKDKDGVYRYENKDREKDPNYILFKKLQDRLSQLRNSNYILNSEWYKIADTRNGFQYYKNLLQKRDEKEEAELAQAPVATTPTSQAPGDPLQQQAQQENNPFLRYKEINKGDFARVSNLASKIIFGEQASTAEELQIQANYKQLLDELVPLYGNKVKDLRKEQLQKRIAFFEGLRDDALVKIIEAKKRIGNLSRQAEDIIQDYKNGQTESAKAKVRKIVKRIQDDIYELETYVEKAEGKLKEFDDKIEQAVMELEYQPDIQNVVRLRESIERDRAWLTDEMVKTRGLIDRLKKLLRELVKIAKDLFIGFDPIAQKPRSTYEENLAKGRFEAVDMEAEILSEGMKLNRLREKLGELQAEYDAMEPTLADMNNQIAEFKAMFNNFTAGLRHRAISAQQQAISGKPEYNAQDIALNQIYNEEVPPNNILTSPASTDYDGPSYQRDLNTVFLSTTDPNYEVGDQRVKNHHELLNNIAQMSNKEISDKLGKGGKLEIFFVTGNNINAFNLGGLVDPKYLNTTETTTTGIYAVYVINRPDGYYFADKNLNIIDKVGQLKDENKQNVVFSSIRAAQYREGEKEVYDKNYPEGATDQALKQAIEFRKRVIDESRNVNPGNMISYRFALTRGLQNKQESADNQPIRNSVTSTLITEDQINPEILSVPTVRTGNTNYEVRTVNGINQKLPVGRPFLLTRNLLNAQYHYLDNNVLNDEQIRAIKMTLYNLAKELGDAIETEMTKMNNGVPVEKYSPLYFARIGELAKRRKELGINFINLDYINFLKGVLFFRQLDEKLPVSAANERQIWLRGDRIVFGNTGDVLYLDNPESFLTSKELDNFLSGYNHNFNSLQEDKKGKPFTEYYVKDDKLAKRTWPTYSHYMLSAKYPDGTPRSYIPLTTKIKTKEQATAEKNSNGQYFPYVQRASTVVTEVQDKHEKNKEKAVVSTVNTPEAQSSVNLLNQLINRSTQQQGKQTLPQILDRVLSSKGSFNDKVEQLIKEGVLTAVTINGKRYTSATYSGRFILFANIGGVVQPIYRSSAGTDNKAKGGWYPFFGFGNLYYKNFETTESLSGFGQNGWLIKGSGTTSNVLMNFEKGHGILSVTEFQKALNKNADFAIPTFSSAAQMASLGLSTASSFEMTTEDRSLLHFNQAIFGKENLGVYTEDSQKDTLNNPKYKGLNVPFDKLFNPQEWIISRVQNLATHELSATPAQPEQTAPTQQPTQAEQAQEAQPKPQEGMSLLQRLLQAGKQGQQEQTQQPSPQQGEVNPVTGKTNQTTNINPDDKDAASDMMNLDNFRVVTTLDVKPEQDNEKVKAEILRMLPQFDVNILDNIIRTVTGRSAWGQFTGAAIEVYRGAEEGTLYHEAFEALVNSILSNREWNNLYKEFKSRKGNFVDRETGEVIAYKDATEYQAKEELAEEFRDYKMSGKVWSGEKQKMNFFQRLLKFLRDFIFNLGSIEKTFENLDTGKYAKAPVRLTTRFTHNYRLIKDIPEAYYHKFIQGATAMMFRDVFLSNKSFTDFDSNIDEATLYNNLRKSLKERYESYISSAMTMPEGNSLRNAIMAAYETFKKIDAQWSSFVEDHKTFLKPFRISFVQEELPDEDSEDKDQSQKNRNDYGQNIMEIDAKKTAATSVRLLFATLVNAKFKQRKGEFFLDEAGMPITEPEVSAANQMFLPELVNYDEIVKTVFNNLTGKNNLSRIEEALKKVAGITELENSENPQSVLANMDNKQAVFFNLYNRIFGNVKEHTPETSWKMKVKFNNFLAKQNPNPELMMLTADGAAYFIESNSKQVFETLKSKTNLHIKGMYGKNFERVVSDNKVFFRTPQVTIPDFSQISEFNRIMKVWFNLGDEFNVPFLQSLTPLEYENISNQLRRVMSIIADRNSNQKIKTLSLDGFGVESRVKDLINFYSNKVSSGTDSQFLNVNRKPQQNYVLNNYMSRIIADLNNSTSKEELLEENPHLGSTFSADSIILDRLFKEGKRTDEKINLNYVEGIMQTSTRTGQKNSVLTLTDRLLLTFNANLKGTYYTLLPADSETEWSLNFGEFVEFSKGFETSKKSEILDIITRYLETEIRIAQEKKLSSLKNTNAAYEDKTNIGDTLRVFRNIIGKDKALLKTIEQGIKDNTDATTLMQQNSKKIGNLIMTYLNDVARKKMQLFINEGIVERDGVDYRFNYLYDKFADKLDKKRTKESGYYFTEDELMDVFRYHTTNYFIANMEMFKLFFGDPAQYKDLSKRVKSFTSGVEWSYYERSEEDGTTGLNGFLNEQKNSASYIDENGQEVSAEIPSTDLFRYAFKNSMNLMVVSDLMVMDVDLYNQLIDPKFKDLINELAKSSDAYAKINEADAQSATDLQTYREIMIKSGWRWTDLHEEQFQYEMAYARNAMSKKGKYKYSSDELKTVDEAILAKYPTPPVLAAFTPIKPLYAGVDLSDKFKNRLLKTSIYPITYRLAEGREMEDLYISMLKGMNKERINIFTFESSHKIGQDLDNNGVVTPLYDSSKPGVMSDFSQRNTPVAPLSFKHFGIQVETQGDKTGNTIGTQLTKDIKLNLFEDGVPIDYIERFNTKQDAINNFYTLTDGDRTKNSDYYKLYKEHEIALRDLKSLGYQELLHKIGAREILEPNGEVRYEYDDLKKVYQIVIDEMLRRELDENTIDSVELTNDLKAFKRAPESLPSYDIMRNILYALVDKAILSPKVNGKPFIQVASTFFNLGKRKASTFDKETEQWIELNTEKEYNEAVKAKKKIVYTSSELGFYKLTKDGTEVQAMEIMLPHIYKQEINDARLRKGKTALTDEQIIKYLEENQPKLLEGIGFRIPTQATSSIEFFKIKGFLPETFGTAVVVPSAITAKAGSDFDVDKLNTYLNNWVLDKKGMPMYVEFMDDSNSTPMQRYNNYIKTRYAQVLSPLRRVIANLSEKDRTLNKAIKKFESDLAIFEDLFNDPTKAVEGKFIAAIFNTSLRDMKDAMRADEELRKLQIEGETLDQLIDAAQREYDQALATIKQDIPYSTFVKMPIFAQNSREALENRYFESIRNILKLPYNFQFLLSPNSMENIENNRNAVMNAENRTVKSKDLDYSQFLDFEYMSTLRHYFVTGKKMIGIFAVGMTNYVNSQVTGLVISPVTDVRQANAFHYTELNNNNPKLPFNYNTINIDGVEYISLSSRFDTDMKSIMDKISGYINGAVDVAKDPVIMDMGMLQDLASTYLLLERIGVPGETVALFMKQPIIRDYIYEIQKRKSALRSRSAYKNNKQIIEQLIKNKYSDGTPYQFEDVKLSNEELSRMLGKAQAAGSREMVNSKFTKRENQLQRLILANFLKAKMYADHLLEVVQSSNHDTANIRSNHVISKKNWQSEDVRKGNSIKSLADFGKVKDGSTVIKQKTFVGNDVDILNRVEKLYGSQIFTLQKDNPARLIKFLGRKIYDSTRYMKNEEFEKSMRELEIQILDYMSNNAKIENIETNVPVKSISDRLFLTNIKVDGKSQKNPYSLKAMYDNLMSSIRKNESHTLNENVFLQNLVFETDDRSGISTFSLKIKPSASDIYTRNRLTEGLRILRDNESSARFYKALLLGSIIQNGVGFTRDSINNMIPNEDYGQQIHQGLINIDSQDFSNFQEILVRTNLDHNIVAQSDPHQISYLNMGNIVSISKTEPYINNPNPFNRNFFGKGPIPPAIFLYAGKEELNDRLLSDYVVVETIHPDYILGPEDGPYMNKISPEIFEMAKRRDFSFIQRILFKKVGLANGKAMYIENPTKTKGTNLMVMYKPINSWGNDKFNEIRNVYRAQEGEWIGEASILKDKTKIQELSDIELMQIIDNASMNTKIYITEDPTNFKNDFTLSVENQNNSLSLPESEISQDEIDKVIDKLKDDSKECNK